MASTIVRFPIRRLPLDLPTREEMSQVERDAIQMVMDGRSCVNPDEKTIGELVSVIEQAEIEATTNAAQAAILMGDYLGASEAEWEEFRDHDLAALKNRLITGNTYRWHTRRLSGVDLSQAEEFSEVNHPNLIERMSIATAYHQSKNILLPESSPIQDFWSPFFKSILGHGRIAMEQCLPFLEDLTARLVAIRAGLDRAQRFAEIRSAVQACTVTLESLQTHDREYYLSARQFLESYSNGSALVGIASTDSYAKYLLNEVCGTSPFNVIVDEVIRFAEKG